jgi:ribosomal protein L19
LDILEELKEAKRVKKFGAVIINLKMGLGKLLLIVREIISDVGLKAIFQYGSQLDV